MKKKKIVAKLLKRACLVCGKKLNIEVYKNGTYKGGEYFGKVELRKNKKTEYWECPKCFK